MYCKNCGDLIPRGAKACPNCRTRIDGKRKKSSAWLWVAGLVLGIAAAFLAFSLADLNLRPKSHDEEVVEDWLTPEEMAEDDAFTPLPNEVVFDQDGVKLTVTGIARDYGYAEVHFIVENSTDRDIAIAGSEVIINGITVHCTLFMEADAGETVNDYLILYDEDLAIAGITGIATLETFHAEIVDSHDYSHIAPISFCVKGDDSFRQSIDDSGKVLYSGNGVTIAYRSVDQDGSFGPVIRFFIRNDTDQDLVFQSTDLAINGQSVNGILSDAVAADTVRYCELSLYDTEQESLSPEEIESLALNINVLNYETFGALFETGTLEVDTTR